MNHGASSLDCQEVIPERYRLRESEEPHADGRKVMAQIAGADWRSCMKRRRENFDQVFTSIAEELRSQYLLG